MCRVLHMEMSCPFEMSLNFRLYKRTERIHQDNNLYTVGPIMPLLVLIATLLKYNKSLQAQTPRCYLLYRNLSSLVTVRNSVDACNQSDKQTITTRYWNFTIGKKLFNYNFVPALYIISFGTL